MIGTTVVHEPLNFVLKTMAYVFCMVEMGGVEPPSEKPPFKTLHAYLIYCFNQNTARSTGIIFGEFVTFNQTSSKHMKLTIPCKSTQNWAPRTTAPVCASGIKPLERSYRRLQL